MNAGSGFTAFNFPDPRVARERITINSKPSSKGACTVVTSDAELLSTQKDRPPSYRPTDPYCPIRPRRPVSADQARTPLRPVHADRRVTRACRLALRFAGFGADGVVPEQAAALQALAADRRLRCGAGRCRDDRASDLRRTEPAARGHRCRSPPLQPTGGP